MKVLKFGGSALRSVASFERVKEIVETERKSDRVLLVVSAMGSSTDELLTLAGSVAKKPCLREQDVLLTVGERIAMSLLSLYLKDRGLEPVSFTGSQAGIITNRDHFDAKIANVRPFRVQRVLEEGKIPIVAGFQGVSPDGEITTLGRGGSDTTAVALAVALNASEVRFYKDVGGIYSEDPKVYEDAAHFVRLDYEACLELMGRFTNVKKAPIHPRAVELARKNDIPLLVCGIDAHTRTKTRIGAEKRSEAPAQFEVA